MHQPSEDALATTLIRGSYEYQGQKCSASSRAYVPRSVWERHRDDFIDQVESLTMGDVSSDLSLFMGAVIDDRLSPGTRPRSSAPATARRSGC